MSTGSNSGNGMLLVSDPDQMSKQLYKVVKTANSTATLTQLNAARANRDFQIIAFYPAKDLKQMNEFVVKALKAKFVTGSTEWIKLADEAELAKIKTKLESISAIVNDSD